MPSYGRQFFHVQHNVMCARCSGKTVWESEIDSTELTEIQEMGKLDERYI